MFINLKSLNYTFKDKPLLIGGKAKEHYGIRKSGGDTDLVVSERDYLNLVRKYPKHTKEIFGDLGIVFEEFEIWKTICAFDYEYLSQGAVELENIKIISLEKLLFLTSLGIHKTKFLKDLKLIVKKVLEEKYK